MTNSLVKKNLLILFLISFSVFLFSIDNVVLNWFVFVPVLFLIQSVSLKSCFLTGGLYGFFSYFFYVFWLKDFNFQYLFLCSFLYFVILGILFLILKFVMQKSEKFTELKLFFVLCIFEFLKTKGFLGFSYGILAYSQYENLFLIQISDIFGIWAIDFLMIFNSVLIYKFFEDFIKNFTDLKKVFFKNLIYFSSFLGILAFFLIYGFFIQKNYQKNENNFQKIKICAVQNNIDPWASDLKTYDLQIKDLIEISKSAIIQNPDIKIIVWPETAVIPAIEKNFYAKNETERKKIVKNLLDFIENQNCAFVIGNFNSRPDEKDFNSAYFFIPKKNVIPPTAQFYSKIHLVPFSEYFPEFLRFWPLNLFFSEDDLWEKGKNYSVFEFENFSFATPICFEDNFGSDLTNFVKNGAKCFINLSNDSWANSKKSQIQHLRMAVFRSVENKIPTVRSTSSGETCFISSCGKIYSRFSSFEKGFTTDFVHFTDKKMSFYSKNPDLLPILFIFISVFYLIYKFVCAFFRFVLHYKKK